MKDVVSPSEGLRLLDVFEIVVAGLRWDGLVFVGIFGVPGLDGILVLSGVVGLFGVVEGLVLRWIPGDGRNRVSLQRSLLGPDIQSRCHLHKSLHTPRMRE